MQNLSFVFLSNLKTFVDIEIKFIFTGMVEV